MSKGSINEIKIEMELEEWLQLKMLFLLGYNLKIFIWWCRELTFGGGMGDGGAVNEKLVGVMSKVLADVRGISPLWSFMKNI